MYNKIKTSGLCFIYIALIAAALDIASKYYIVQNFNLYESIEITHFFNITYVPFTSCGYVITKSFISLKIKPRFALLPSNSYLIFISCLSILIILIHKNNNNTNHLKTFVNDELSNEFK